MAHRRRRNEARQAAPDAPRSGMGKDQRNRILLGVGVIGVAILLVAVLVMLPGGPPLLTDPPAVGERAPDFTVVDIDGTTFRLSAHSGAPVLIDFMGSRCTTCAATMPDLRSIYDEFSARGLMMISIDIGGTLGTEDPSVARGFMAAHGGTWPIALDNSGVGLQYGAVRPPPTVYIIDPSGLVAYWNPGPTSVSTLRGIISQYV
jgi:peroxiredoxin